MRKLKCANVKKKGYKFFFKKQKIDDLPQTYDEKKKYFKFFKLFI